MDIEARPPFRPDMADILNGRRMRRLRRAPWSRRLVRENTLTVDDLIWPIFVTEGTGVREPVPSMPGVVRYSVDEAGAAAQEAASLNIPVIAVFPYSGPEKRDEVGSEATNPDNLVCRTCRTIKQAAPDIGIMTDVALDPYTSHGHDGVMAGEEILNDETIAQLVSQAIV
ncbi:MAG: porphobilinogen synthase, partial [Pseudomonadota bacterium]